MIKTKTYEFKGRVYSEIPDEVADKLELKAGDELFFEVGENVVIKVLKGNSFLSADEKIALAELNEIKHAERTRERVDADFDSKIIDGMIGKKIIFRYSKEGKEMVGVDRNYSDFRMASGILGELEVDGYLILEPERIQELEYALESAKRTSDVIGIRGFDKKFYVMLAAKFKEWKDKILDEIKQPKSIFEASKNLKTNEALCKTALEIMKEQGEVIEKRKNTFQAV